MKVTCGNCHQEAEINVREEDVPAIGLSIPCVACLHKIVVRRSSLPTRPDSDFGGPDLLTPTVVPDGKALELSGIYTLPDGVLPLAGDVGPGEDVHVDGDEEPILAPVGPDPDTPRVHYLSVGNDGVSEVIVKPATEETSLSDEDIEIEEPAVESLELDDVTNQMQAPAALQAIEAIPSPEVPPAPVEGGLRPRREASPGSMIDDLTPLPPPAPMEANWLRGSSDFAGDLTPARPVPPSPPPPRTDEPGPLPGVGVRAASGASFTPEDLFSPPPTPLPFPTPHVPPLAVTKKKRRARPPARIRIGWIAKVTAVALAMLALVGGALLRFTSIGAGAVTPPLPRAAEAERVVREARRRMSDDTALAYRDAALRLERIAVADPDAVVARALAAQAELSAALLGYAGDGQHAEAWLAELASASRDDPEVSKARALRALAANKTSEADALLTRVVVVAPRDAQALVYAGWTRLADGDPAAAGIHFEHALAIDPHHVGALYGHGRALELADDATGARDAYRQALELHPGHLGAALGDERVSAEDTVHETARVLHLVAQRSVEAAPVLLAEAWALIGQRALDFGFAEEAEDRYRRALVLDGGSVEARIGLARALLPTGGVAEALALLEPVLAAHPRDPKARLALVEARLANRDPRGAGEALAPLARQAPRHARVRYWQGRIAEALGGAGDDASGDESAATAYSDAVAADPDLVGAHLALIRLYRRGGHDTEADAAQKRLDARAAGDVGFAVELGCAYLALGDAQRAEAVLRQAGSAEPKHALARLRRAEALVALRRLDQAALALDELAKLEPAFPRLANVRARVAARQGRQDEAAARYDEALAEPYPTAALRVEAARFHARAGHADRARELLVAVLRDDDRSVPAHLGLSQLALLTGSLDEAAAEASRALVLGGGPAAHLALAAAEERLGRVDAALLDYSAARTGATELDARIGRARLSAHRGAVKDALDELEEVIQLDPDRVDAYLTLGDCQDDLGHHDAARDAYARAAQRDPHSPEAAFKHGRALWDAGKPADASVELERALGLGGAHAPFAAEAYLLDGDARRATRDPKRAIDAYKKYLEVARRDAPERRDAERALQLLEAH